MNDGLSKEDKWMVEQIELQFPFVLKLSDPDKSRCLLGLAYEYFLMDMEEKAYELLRQADPNYFKEQLAKDMREIPNMDKIVLRIMGKLIDIGVVVVDSE